MTKEERKVQRLKERIARLGPVLPGSISEQWNICGTQGCKCKDPNHPVKHGPYYQLSFTIGGKSSTMFVKKKDLTEVRRRMKRYQQFKVLTKDLVRAYVELARRSGFNGS